MSSQQNIEYYLSHGRCPRCGGKNRVEPGAKMCDECRDRRNELRRLKRSQRRAKGLCTVCGGPLDDERYATCGKCRKKHHKRRGKADAISRKIWYDKQREEGRCVSCGGWAVPGRARCRACQDRNNRWHKRYDPTGEKKREERRKLIEEGRCIDCRRPTQDVRKRCDRCVAMRRESTRKYDIMQRIRRELNGGKQKPKA